jgi:methyltransferase (TIGR00027 family)
MEKGKPSKTSEVVAIYRAIHQLVDAQPLVFFDPIAPQIIDRTSDFYVRLFTERGQQMARARRGAFVLRSRYAEDCLKDVVLRGIRQYLILGAGLDTFAYRQPQSAHELTIYEVDHHITQQWKYERLAAAGIALPDYLQFTSVDFESMSLREGLRASSFDSRRRRFALGWVWSTFLRKRRLMQLWNSYAGCRPEVRSSSTTGLPRKRLRAAKLKQVDFF